MTWAEFLLMLMRLIDGDENTPTDLPIGTLTHIIRLGEQRIYNNARGRGNEKSFASAIVAGVTAPLVVTGNLAPIPDDFEAVRVIHFGRLPLMPLAEEALMERNYPARAGDCTHFAQAGRNFTFSAPVANATAVQGRYFCRLPPLTEASIAGNALFADSFELFVYAALVEGAPIFNKAKDLTLWTAKYAQALAQVNTAHAMAAYSGGRIRRSTSTRVIR